MIFEIINPSDTYTCVADDPKIAMAAVLLLGHGQLGLQDETGKSYDTLLFALSKEQITATMKELFGPGGFNTFIAVPANKAAISSCLDSVISLGIGQRKCFDDFMATLPDKCAREKYRTELHDKNRTSLNDWGTAAWELAKKLAQPEPEQENA